MNHNPLSTFPPPQQKPPERKNWLSILVISLLVLTLSTIIHVINLHLFDQRITSLEKRVDLLEAQLSRRTDVPNSLKRFNDFRSFVFTLPIRHSE